MVEINSSAVEWNKWDNCLLSMLGRNWWEVSRINCFQNNASFGYSRGRVGIINVYPITDFQGFQISNFLDL